VENDFIAENSICGFQIIQIDDGFALGTEVRRQGELDDSIFALNVENRMLRLTA
jgi:hypothetical protein